MALVALVVPLGNKLPGLLAHLPECWVEGTRRWAVSTVNLPPPGTDIDPATYAHLLSRAESVFSRVCNVTVASMRRPTVSQAVGSGKPPSTRLHRRPRQLGCHRHEVGLADRACECQVRLFVVLRVELESREARTVLIAHLNLERLGDLVLAQNKRDQNTTPTAYIHNRRMIFAVLCRRCKVEAGHVTLLPSTLSMDYQQNVSNQTCLA